MAVNDNYMGHFWVVEWCSEGEQRGLFHVAPFADTLLANMQVFAGVRAAKYNDRWLIVGIAPTAEGARELADKLRDAGIEHGLNRFPGEALVPQPIRNAIELNLLKRMPYEEYLRTDYWQRVRKEVLRRAEYRCQLCNADSELHIHHRSYENRGEERSGDVIALCATCHAKFHGKDEP